jgi:hypothetical protein
VARKILPKEIENSNNEPDSIREFAAEAELVAQLIKQPGWAIIERDLCAYREQIGKDIAYLDPTTKEFKEARILYIASDKILSLFRDYEENHKRAIELLKKLDNPQEDIALDVDNGI